MSVVRRTASLVGAVVLVCVLAVPALAIYPEASVNVTLSGQVAGVTCGKAIPLFATVAGASGTGVPEVAVAWVITSSPSGAHDTLGFATTTSGTNGVATNTLTLSCVAGKRVVQGGVLGAISSISLTPSDLQGGVLGAISFNLTPSGLPNTATVLDPYTSPSLPAASLLFLVIATGFGVALGVRRFRA